MWCRSLHDDDGNSLKRHVGANDDDDSGQGLGRWSKILTTTAEPRDQEVVQAFDGDDDG